MFFVGIHQHIKKENTMTNLGKVSEITNGQMVGSIPDIFTVRLD